MAAGAAGLFGIYKCVEIIVEAVDKNNERETKRLDDGNIREEDRLTNQHRLDDIRLTELGKMEQNRLAKNHEREIKRKEEKDRISQRFTWEFCLVGKDPATGRMIQSSTKMQFASEQSMVEYAKQMQRETGAKLIFASEGTQAIGFNQQPVQFQPVHQPTANNNGQFDLNQFLNDNFKVILIVAVIIFAVFYLKKDT